MAKSLNEWELSKENIQPIQQGRKQNILKVALATQPEDSISQQRQRFEQELRIYSGDDPLSVWCQYIKWVEQNFPKGGREGQIEKLIQQCLTVLKDESKYFNDKRFVDVWLKYANISIKPIEVYNYMYSHSIGCTCANFFIAWAWELEQQNNFKKANEVLTEGIHRNAEPVERLKSARSEFENRMAIRVKESDPISDAFDMRRSAFSLLNPVNKRNEAPVARVGDAVVPPQRELMTLGKRQPQPKSTIQSKVPFKIYNQENISSALPVRTESGAPFVLHSDATKENEKKARKWNKVKMQQTTSATTTIKDKVNVGFTFHCDQTPQPELTPRSVAKSSSVLSTRHKVQSPPMAVFEPLDPMKRPMYDKNKVYGGTEEFSLEEIRAAKWFEKQKKIKEEQEKKELENKVKALEYQVEQLQKSNVKCSGTERNTQPTIACGLIRTSSLEKGIQNLQISNAKKQVPYSTKSLNNEHLSFPQNASQLENTDSVQFQCNSSGYRNAGNLIQEFYNSTLTKPNDDLYNSDPSAFKDDYRQSAFSVVSAKKRQPVVFSDSRPVNNEMYVKKDALQDEISSVETPQSSMPFDVFRDPTEIVAGPTIVSTNFTTAQNVKHGERQVKNSLIEEPKNCMPFNIHYDQTNEFLQENTLPEGNKISVPEVNDKNFNPLYVESFKENVQPAEFQEVGLKENLENVPPVEYVQEHIDREIVGILVPSKNIYFVPLEDQDEVDDDDEADYDIENDGQAIMDRNETLIAPVNTEQFASAAFLASTPCIKAKKTELEKFSDMETKYNIMPPPSEILFQPPKKVDHDNSGAVKTDTILPTEVDKSVPHDPKIVNGNTPAVPVALPGRLSIIMETSRECYSKSSSSSSCSSSVGSTKLGVSHYSHQHISSYSHQHSMLRKQISRADTFAETDVPSSVTQISRSLPNQVTSTPKEQAEMFSLPAKVNMEHKPETALELYCVDLDPFDKRVTTDLLNSLTVPISKHQNLFFSKGSITNVKVGVNINVGGRKYTVEKLIAEGAYAKVFVAQTNGNIFSNDFEFSCPYVALKVCRDANAWEYYICTELHARLSRSSTPPDVKHSVMEVTSALSYRNGIILVTDYSEQGTLLDIVNIYKKQGSSVPECLVMYFALGMLQVVSKLHECHIIHGDIKPDNFLLTKDSIKLNVCENLLEKTTSLCLIDFGRAIDLNFFKKGACFNTVVTTDGFVCNEMKENKPWVFQPDWYGVLGSIHVLLFSDYMKVKKNNDGKWEPVQKFKRYWENDIWEPLFHSLLNIPSCYKEPDIKPFVHLIASKLQENEGTFITQAAKLQHLFLC